MCSGTMSQLTTGPHLPFVAWIDSGERSMVGAATTVSVGMANRSVCSLDPPVS